MKTRRVIMVQAQSIKYLIQTTQEDLAMTEQFDERSTVSSIKIRSNGSQKARKMVKEKRKKETLRVVKVAKVACKR